MESSALVEDVVIVGAGIAGLAIAVALNRVGIRALVLERAEGLRTTGAALTLFTNAWKALDALGVSHRLTPLYAPVAGSSITDVATGTVQYFPLNLDASKGPRPVHRKVLLEALAQELPPESIRFSSRLAAIETREEGGVSVAIVLLEDGTLIKSKVLIGCDGVHSVVARWLGLSDPVDSGRSAARGLAIYPEGHGLKQEVHQFVDVGKRAGFGPLNDKEIYWFMLWRPSTNGEKISGDPEVIQREILENYAKDFPSEYLDVARHADLPNLSWGPLMFRYPWSILFGNLTKGNITVAGDAMHPMTPDLGQGGCAALEDAVVLGRHIANSVIRNNGKFIARDIEDALKGYVNERRWRVAGLVTGSYLSGWVQQGGSNWCMKLFRDVFYKHLTSKIFTLLQYDCGKLPEQRSDHREGRMESSIVVEDVVIVGAGIAGLGIAVALKRAGINALVLERAEGLRTTGAALSLFPNAWKALDALGVSHKLTPLYAPLTGHGPRPVHRKVLLEALAQELPPASIRFSSRLAAIESREEGGVSIAIVHLEDGTIIKSRVLIGCDGVHSVVARWLGLSDPVDLGRSASRGLGIFPEGHGLTQELHQFVDVGKRGAIGPVNDKEIFWFMLWRPSTKGEKMSSDPKVIQREILENYAKDFPSEYLDVIRHADLPNLSWTPLIFRHPWSILFGNLSKGNITVAGDAMHPMTPDIAQGACAALEDAVVLGRHIANSVIRNNGKFIARDIEEALKGYVNERRWRVAGLVTWSYLSGWVQQVGSNWWMRLFRNKQRSDHRGMEGIVVEDVVVVGAGIAGLAAAVALRRVGVRALVLERAEGLRATGAAITLFPNGWKALDVLGVSHKLTPLYSSISKSSVTNVATGSVQQVFLEHGPRAVPRKALLEALAQELPVDSIRFSSRLAAIETQEHEGQNVSVDPKVIRRDILENHTKDFPSTFLDVVRRVDLSTLTWAPLTLRYPWSILFGNLSKGNVTVTGDAMHPMTPELGQGGSSALEDAVILGRHIANSVLIKNNGKFVAGDIEEAFKGYVNERRWRVARLVTGSYLSGWIQQEGSSNWLMRLFRDLIFYRHLLPRFRRKQSSDQMEGIGMEDVVVVGAGIAGLAAAVALRRVGVRALVLERAEGLRATGAAITLVPSGWKALDVLEALAQELPVDSIRFSSRLAAVETQECEGSPIVVMHLEDGTIIKSKALIGCDGVHSVVARWLGLSEPVHSGRIAARGLANFPEGHGFSQELHQFVDVGKRALFIPLTHQEVIRREILENHTRDFPTTFLDVVRRVDLSTLSWAPLTLRYPWSILFDNLSKGNVTVTGDAMHPMTPELGQGGSSALEDAVILGRHIANSVLIKNNGKFVAGDIEEAIKGYVNERRWRVAGLVTGSYLSGWIQQEGSSNWWMRLFRDLIFYRHLLPRFRSVAQHDCGKLPTISSDESDDSARSNKTN
ncbi:hypothetical protein Tsubulata_020865, partial [Turnera subulata]